MNVFAHTVISRNAYSRWRAISSSSKERGVSVGTKKELEHSNDDNDDDDEKVIIIIIITTISREGQ